MRDRIRVIRLDEGIWAAYRADELLGFIRHVEPRGPIDRGRRKWYAATRPDQTELGLYTDRRAAIDRLGAP